MKGLGEAGERRDYVPVILRAMAETDTAQRKLAGKTGISKSRLGVLLHRDPAKRAPMTVNEFETILHALGTNIVQAFVRLETFPQDEPISDERHATLIVMLCEFFVSLPKKLIEVLDALDGLDGSEVRKEWASPLQKAVIKRVADEVMAVTERRARLAQSDDFYL
ncbi:XRE family transcriptional regulator [Sphingomonas sp. 3P27F8]|nr:XRE family transcriptional regulator [Sphingomonas sp. 3P27F8]